jgi:GNAT superfamily N-acetyltransferase
MRGIMTEKTSSEKPSNFVCRQGDETSSARVAEALGIEIAARFGPRSEQPLSIQVYDGDALVGGVNGCTHWSWCYIRQLWVAENRRGLGLGRLLLDYAEAEALARTCIGLYLDTFDPAAEKFYEACGFRRFGRIDDFPPGHVRRFLSKRLLASGPLSTFEHERRGLLPVARNI